MKMRFPLLLGLAAMLGLAGTIPLCAEDWTTKDGTTYHDVKVVQAEPDAVTILHHDGGGRIPMEKLPPDLQQRFHYDPAAAKVAADARAKKEADDEAAAMLAQAQQMADDAIRRAAGAAEAAAATTTEGGTTHYGRDALNMHTLRPPADSTHHTMGELAGSMSAL